RSTTMAAEFQIPNERVVITKYIDPVHDVDLIQMVSQLDAYAKKAPQTILAIADFSEVKKFPHALLTLGLRQGNVNPVRNPKIDTIMVFAESAFLASIASTIARITGSKKIVFVQTRSEVDAAIEAFVKKTSDTVTNRQVAVP